MTLAANHPVLAGTGVAHGRGEEASELIVAAVLAAGDDTGAPDLLSRAGDVAVTQGTWSYRDPARLVAAAIGTPSATTVLADVGVPQQTLVSRALALIIDGAVDVAIVAGGDTKGRSDGSETDQGSVEPGVHLRPAGELMARAEVQARAWEPVAQYAMVDVALGHAEGRSVGELRDDVAELWARFSAVSESNPSAAFAGRRSPEFLRNPGPENRLLAFPYNKWHSTQWRVEQAAALVLCSAAAARRAGVDPERCVLPRVALESSHSLSLSRRRDLHRWPAMAALARRAEDRLGRSLRDVEHVEVYSCFPAAVRVQQRELGLPLDGTPTVTGGMAFAGGPFNNFTYQATHEIVGRCRAEPGSLGMVTTVSGLLTKPGLMVWSTDGGRSAPLVADLAEVAAVATCAVEVADGYRGPARVASYTATPDRVAVIADTADGRRAVASRTDPALVEQAQRDSLIGLAITVNDTTFELQE